MHDARAVRVSRRIRDPWLWTRLTVGAAILAVLFWQLGVEAFLEPLQRIDVPVLAATAAIVLVTTVCSAWRWRLVSRGLGTHLPLGTAVGAYYRSQFLNLVLPGGVLGDVHRAVARGRDVGSVGHGVRVVAWERSAGQVVQVTLTVLALLVLPSPVRSSMPVLLVVLVAVALAVVLLGLALSRRGHPAIVRFVRAVVADVRHGLLARPAWPGVLVASAVVVAGHTATFLIAARTAGSTASVSEMLPLALLVLLATALPTNIAGWGPREGAAAWVFAAAGLGATLGVGTAVVYGVLAIVATLPGAVLLAVSWLRPRTRRTQTEKGAWLGPEPKTRHHARASLEGATHG